MLLETTNQLEIIAMQLNGITTNLIDLQVQMAALQHEHHHLVAMNLISAITPLIMAVALFMMLFAFCRMTKAFDTFTDTHRLMADANHTLVGALAKGLEFKGLIAEVDEHLEKAGKGKDLNGRS